MKNVDKTRSKHKVDKKKVELDTRNTKVDRKIGKRHKKGGYKDRFKRIQQERQKCTQKELQKSRLIRKKVYTKIKKKIHAKIGK